MIARLLRWFHRYDSLDSICAPEMPRCLRDFSLRLP